MRRVLATVTLATLAASWILAGQADWSSCGRSLGTLSDESSTAKRQSDDVESKQRDYDDQQRRYDRCRQYPDTYDTYSDGCATLLRRARSAQSSLDSAVGNLQQKIRYVSDAFDSVKSSCNASSDGNATLVCAALKSMRSKYSEAEVLALCKTRMSEALCKTCLSIK